MFSKCQQSKEKNEQFLHTLCKDAPFSKSFGSIKRLRYKKSLKILRKLSNQLITQTKCGCQSQLPSNFNQVQLKSKNLHIIRNVVNFHQIVCQVHPQTIFSLRKDSSVHLKQSSKYERKFSLAAMPNNTSLASHCNRSNQERSFTLSEQQISHSLTISKSQYHLLRQHNCNDQKSTHFEYGKSIGNSSFKRLKSTISLQSQINQENSIVLENNYLKFF